MSDATWTGFDATPAAPEAQRQEEVRPAPVPFDAPVLIGDAATPLAGETVLGLLMKRLAERDLG